jgi:hypothetical protein
MTLGLLKEFKVLSLPPINTLAAFFVLLLLVIVLVAVIFIFLTGVILCVLILLETFMELLSFLLITVGADKILPEEITLNFFPFFLRKQFYYMSFLA